jgi:hypothetical protein
MFQRRFLMELRRVCRFVALFFVTVLCYSIAGCSTKPADMRGKIVASVGEEKIAVRDVRELFGVRAAAHKVFGVPKEENCSQKKAESAGTIQVKSSRNVMRRERKISISLHFSRKWWIGLSGWEMRKYAQRRRN